MASENYVQEKIEESAPRFFSCPEAEENILRRMFKSRGVAEDVVNELSGADFADVNLGRLFSAIKLVVQDGAQVDFATVDAAFSRRFPRNADAIREKMIDIVAPKPYTIGDNQSISDHIRIVRDLSARRAAIQRIDEAAQQLRDPSKGIDEALSEMRKSMDGLDAGNDAWMPMADVLMNSYNYIEGRSEGRIKAITTGIPDIDRIIGGFYGGEMTVIAARPSVGKSAFAVNIALSAARDGFKVGVVSLEMTDIGFGQRILARGADVDGSVLRMAKITPDVWSKLGEGLRKYGEYPVDFLFRCNTVEDVCAAVRRRARKGKLDILIVDYIGIMQTRKRFRERREKIGYISWSLKQLALEANIPVVALAQVNRDAQGNMPTMANLRDSGDIEQDADGIIFLHRPNSTDGLAEKDVTCMAVAGENDMTYIMIDIAKQRQGRIGKAGVYFHPETMTYTGVSREGI